MLFIYVCILGTDSFQLKGKTVFFETRKVICLYTAASMFYVQCCGFAFAALQPDGC